jgi:hypothetical protein
MPLRHYYYLFYGRFTFYSCFLYLLTHTGVQHDFPVIWCWCHLTVTRRVTIVERELLTLPENLRSSRYILDLYIYICHMTLDCRWESMWENEINPATLNYKFFWRLWIYPYFEYVDCNIWFLALVSLAKLHPFNANIWKSPSTKSLFVDKYENDTQAHHACDKNRYCMQIKHLDLKKERSRICWY